MSASGTRSENFPTIPRGAGRRLSGRGGGLLEAAGALLMLAVSGLMAADGAEPVAPPAGEADHRQPRSSRAGRVDELLGRGEYGQAEAEARLLLAEAEASGGSDALEAAIAIDRLVEALWRGGKAGEQETEALARRALRIKEALLGPDHVEVGRSLHHLARVHGDRGDYARARPLYERSLAIRERALGPEDPEVARALQNLAILLKNLGHYDESRALHERALAIRRARLGPDHPEVAQSLHSLAALAWTMGDRTRGLALVRQAIAIWEKAHGPEHPRLATSLEGLGVIAMEEGDWTNSRMFIERALRIHEKRLGASHPSVANALANLAQLAAAVGQFGEAEPMARRALAIYESASGADHPDVAFAATILADVLARSGRVKEAGPLLERALRIRQAVLGPEHPLSAQSLVGLSRNRWLAGEVGPALEGALRAAAIHDRRFRDVARSLSEREALRFAAARVRGRDLALSILTGAPPRRLPPGSVAAVWDTVIRGRGRVLDEIGARHRVLVEDDDPQVEALRGALDLARGRLSRLIVATGRGAPGPHQDRLREAQEDKERAERALAERSAGYRRELADRRAGFAEIAAALPADTALVAYVRFEMLPGREAPGPGESIVEPTPSYLAFVLRSGSDEPEVLRLGPAMRLEALVREWHRAVAATPAGLAGLALQAERDYRRIGARLRRAVWDPVAAAAGDARMVFVVSDGALYRVSLSALPSGRGGYLAETAPTLHHLSTERSVLRRSPEGPPGRGLIAIGGIDFDTPPARAGSDGTAEREGRGPSASRPGRRPAYRGERSSCEEFTGLSFDPLPGALLEIDEVAALWAGRPGNGTAGPPEPVVVLTGAGASEDAFKEQVPGKRVVHVATHGFFLADRCAAHDRAAGEGSALSATADRLILRDNPLLLAGLALAGANRRAQTRGTEAEDGILTAEEIAALDLSGVEWVVLSGCDTGLGRPEAGEGVLGLRRSIEGAGAGTLIMSLWAVEDVVVREWMGRLYEGRLAGLTTAEAVSRASTGMIAERRRAGRSTHPFYWGAFVAAGDWR
jgi:CHAT domain-containing protein/tetratricopeptide (TPR) repeat protein